MLGHQQDALRGGGDEEAGGVDDLGLLQDLPVFGLLNVAHLEKHPPFIDILGVFSSSHREIKNREIPSSQTLKLEAEKDTRTQGVRK
jgi:hypothetical protein